jgi:hypothetical protein
MKTDFAGRDFSYGLFSIQVVNLHFTFEKLSLLQLLNC